MTAQILTSVVFLKSSRRDKACSSVEDHMLLRTKSEFDWLPLHLGAAPLFFYLFTQNGVSTSLIRCRLNAGFQIIWLLGTAIALATGCDF